MEQGGPEVDLDDLRLVLPTAGLALNGPEIFSAQPVFWPIALTRW